MYLHNCPYYVQINFVIFVDNFVPSSGYIAPRNVRVKRSKRFWKVIGSLSYNFSLPDNRCLGFRVTKEIIFTIALHKVKCQEDGISNML